MASLSEHAHRLADHALRWAGLALTDVPSAAVSDDDNDYTGDMRHLDNMLDEIVHACATTHGATVKPLGSVHSTILDLAIEELEFDWPADEAGEALAAWRGELEHERQWTAWWLYESTRTGLAA